MIDWQPIETAPRDGTSVLLAQGDLLEHGSWGFIETSDWDGMKCYGWLTDYGRIEEPTHWMPALPPVPKIGSGTEPQQEQADTTRRSASAKMIDQCVPEHAEKG